MFVTGAAFAAFMVLIFNSLSSVSSTRISSTINTDTSRIHSVDKTFSARRSPLDGSATDRPFQKRSKLQTITAQPIFNLKSLGVHESTSTVAADAAASHEPTTITSPTLESTTITSPTLKPTISTDEDCIFAKAPNPFPNQCGRFNASRVPTPSQSRIVNGQTAALGQIPWQLVMIENTWLRSRSCGATIIGPRHAITAAHCIPLFSVGYEISAGHVGRSDVSCTRQTRHIIRVQVHPCYCDSGGCNLENSNRQIVELQFDVAILTVNAPFWFNEFVQPACLPSSEENLPVGTLVSVSGFGNLRWGGTSSETLQVAEKPIVSQEECLLLYKPLNNKITEDMICAGTPNSGVDACQNDSGGPLVVIDRNNSIATLAGVVSWGQGCAQEHPGVYARVSNFTSWIKQAMKDVSADTTRISGHQLIKFNSSKCYRYLQGLSGNPTTEEPQRIPPTTAVPERETTWDTWATEEHHTLPPTTVVPARETTWDTWATEEPQSLLPTTVKSEKEITEEHLKAPSTTAMLERETTSDTWATEEPHSLLPTTMMPEKEITEEHLKAPSTTAIPERETTLDTWATEEPPKARSTTAITKRGTTLDTWATEEPHSLPPTTVLPERETTWDQWTPSWSEWTPWTAQPLVAAGAIPTFCFPTYLFILTTVTLHMMLNLTPIIL